MLPYPIVMTTFERPEVCQKSIESLEKSEVDLSYFHIYDDHSVGTHKIKQLNELSNKYTVIKREKNMGTVLNTIPAIQDMFIKYSSEFIIFLQDDVIFSRSWLIKGIELIREINQRNHIAFLCLFNRDEKHQEKYYIMNVGHPGGVAWIINRFWWYDYQKKHNLDDDMALLLKFEKDRSIPYKVKNLVDFKLAHRAHTTGWDVAKVGQSLVQHIGDISSLSNRDMAFCRTKNFVGENE